MAQHTGVIAWLTLVVSLMITGDLVMDLAFEEPYLGTSADASPIPEEPDNAAEHILMPSQRGDASPTEAAYLTGISIVVQATLLFACIPSLVIARVGPAHERPPRSSPVPLLLPLRI